MYLLMSRDFKQTFQKNHEEFKLYYIYIIFI